MSVYKIVIGKDMAPQNKNTYHMEAFFCTPRSMVLTLFALHMINIYRPIYKLNNKMTEETMNQSPLDN